MSEVVRFSDAVNLGFHAMIQLAEKSEVGELPLREIAAAIEVSEAHLSKVLQRLRKVGMVFSTRGPTGGFRLAKDPADIRFYDIFEAIDGPMTPRSCLFLHPVCPDHPCGLGVFIGQLNLNVKTFLENLTLAKAVSGHKENKS